MPETDWPYDADQRDPLTKLRIAVTSAWPGWAYLLAFDRDSTARPTDAETAVMASWIEFYIDKWYNDRWKARLAERPFDIDGGANGITLHKRGDDDWMFKKWTWRTGFWPYWNVAGTFSLVQVLDKDQEIVPGKWDAWKAARPEVFGEVANA